MHIYDDLLQLIPTVKKLKQDHTLPTADAERQFITAMADKMVPNYQEFILYDGITEKNITSFNQDTVLAALTLIIRKDYHGGCDGTLEECLQSGQILALLEKLNLLLNTEHKLLLNDIFQMSDLDQVKIRLNFDYSPNHWNVIDAFKNGDIEGLLRGHYWNYKGHKSYKEGQTTIGLLRINPKENLWLLFHVGKVTKDLNLLDGLGYEFEALKKYDKFIGRVIVKYKNKSQSSVRNAKSLIDKCEVYQVLPDIFDNDIFPGYENVNVSWMELSRIIEKESWKTALQNQKAVYLITDISNGKMYVGSAYGEHMLLNRWKDYIQNGHGENVGLKKLSKDYIEENFRYSILDIFKSKTDDKTILNREIWWKEALLTRKFGYNLN